MPTIPLHDGKGHVVAFAEVDDCDYERVAYYHWTRLPGYKTFYAMTRVRKQSISMHRFILGLGKGDGRIVDHRDRNGLNNKRDNIWICTTSDNVKNCVRTKRDIEMEKVIPPEACQVGELVSLKMIKNAHIYAVLMRSRTLEEAAETLDIEASTLWRMRQQGFALKDEHSSMSVLRPEQAQG